MTVPRASRAALVTGASKGIGFAIAERLARRAYALTLVARDAATLDAARKELLDAGAHDVLTVAADLVDPAVAAACVDEHARHHGRLDVVALSAGTGTVAPIEEQTPSRIDRMLDLNLRAPMLLLRHALPLLRTAGTEHGEAGVFVVSSITGEAPPPGYSVYAATKAGVTALAKAINAEASASGVRAAALSPGFVDTDMTTWVRSEIPATEMLAVTDVAEGVEFLLRLSRHAVVAEIVLARAGAPLCGP